MGNSRCFQEAKNPGSNYATVAKATGKDEEEVKRLLRGLDIDREDAEFQRQAEDHVAATGRTARPQGRSPSARANKKAFAEVVKYLEMRQKGVPIPEIADQEGKTAQDVVDSLRILDLNKEKQEQIKQGKLDPEKAVQAQRRLMNQVIEELPNHVLLPNRIAPTSEVFMDSLFQIKRFLDHLTDMELMAYIPALREAIIQMAKNVRKDCERVKKAVEEQRIEWQAQTERTRSQKPCNETRTRKADAKKNKKKAKGKRRTRVKVDVLPDRDLLPLSDEKKTA